MNKTKSSLHHICLAAVAGLVISSTSFAAAEKHDTAAIKQRIAPAGKVHIDSSNASKADKKVNAERKPVVKKADASSAKKGHKVYQTYCSACHATGAASAPMLSKPEQWKARIQRKDNKVTNEDVLIEHVIKGYKFMPPMGTCMSCSKEDIHAAVSYMLKKIETEQGK